MSRSTPMAAPMPAANVKRRMISCKVSIGYEPSHRPHHKKQRCGTPYFCEAVDSLERDFTRLQLKLGQFREVACSSVYLAALEGAQAVQAELFHSKAAHHRAVDHGAAQGRVGLAAGPGQVAHESAGKAVA